MISNTRGGGCRTGATIPTLIFVGLSRTQAGYIGQKFLRYLELFTLGPNFDARIDVDPPEESNFRVGDCYRKV